MAEPRVVAYSNTGCEFNFGMADDIFANVVGPPSAKIKPGRVKMNKKTKKSERAKNVPVLSKNGKRSLNFCYFYATI